jgi:hypothetical protein
VRVYRWDLDKTYLETDFESLRGLVRSAIEDASSKRAVPGATPLLQALCAPPENRIYILSGSPVQLREVLEEKLRLDGIRYEGLVLKDSLRHLRKGRVRAIKEQFGYKLPVLLTGRDGMGRACVETLFGDDAEVDALVYSVYADLVAGRMGPAEVSRIMEAAGAYAGAIAATVEAIDHLSTAEAVERIFIRLEKRRPPALFDALGSRCVPIYSWWQAALVLHGAGHIDGIAAGEVMQDVARGRGRGPWQMAALTQDIVRRGHVAATALDSVRAASELLDASRAAVARLRDLPPPRAPGPPAKLPDYLRLVQTWGDSG